MVLSFMLQGADTVMKVCQSLASCIANYKIFGSSLLTVNFISL